MPVYALRIACSAADAGNVAHLLQSFDAPAPLAVSFFEAEDTTAAEISWLAEALFEAAPDADTIRAFLDEAAPSTIRQVRDQDLNLQVLPDTNWVAKVQSDLAPVHAGGFTIYGSHDRGSIPPSRTAIEIDAGEAFGTAHHGTTAGCLIAIDKALRALGPRAQVMRGLDVGTGTGILAIAMVRGGLGCRLQRPVLATDIDPIAISVTDENLAKNRVRRQIRTAVATGLSHRSIAQHAPYGLITANILAQPLMGLAPQFGTVVRPGARLILSGLVDEQAAMVLARYVACGWIKTARQSHAGWTTLTLRRR